MFYTERKESMSPDGFLRMIREEDGDLILCVGQGEPNGGVNSIVEVQFCTPFSGGGGSSKTWAALCQLMGAMAEDNLDMLQVHRRGDVSGFDQQPIVDWAKQCRDAKLETRA